MCSQCNEKLNRKLNTLKCCSKYLHVRHMYPPRFFSPSNWKVVALQTDTQTQRICCLQWQTTPSPERKVTAPLFHFFEGGVCLFQSTLTLHSAKLFFYYVFGQCFYSNCPTTLCLNRAITGGPFQKIPSVVYSLWRTFQAYLFSYFSLRDNPQRQFLTVRQMRLAEILEGKGTGLLAWSCLGGVLSLNSLPWGTTTFSCNFCTLKAMWALWRSKRDSNALTVWKILMMYLKLIYSGPTFSSVRWDDFMF